MNRNELRRHRASGLSNERRHWRSIGRLRGAVARLANVPVEALEERRLLAADLAVAKFDAPDPVFAGNNLNYTVVVSNNGDVPARTAAFTDARPAGVSLHSAPQATGPPSAVTSPAARTPTATGGGPRGQLTASAGTSA